MEQLNEELNEDQIWDRLFDEYIATANHPENNNHEDFMKWIFGE